LAILKYVKVNGSHAACGGCFALPTDNRGRIDEKVEGATTVRFHAFVQVKNIVHLQGVCFEKFRDPDLNSSGVARYTAVEARCA
jgi:hypothetical protein